MPEPQELSLAGSTHRDDLACYSRKIGFDIGSLEDAMRQKEPKSIQHLSDILLSDANSINNLLRSVSEPTRILSSQVGDETNSNSFPGADSDEHDSPLHNYECFQTISLDLLSPDPDEQVPEKLQPAEGVLLIDEFGFYIPSTQPSWKPNLLGMEERANQAVSLIKCGKYLAEWPTLSEDKKNKAKAALRNGIPNPIRGAMWSRILEIPAEEANTLSHIPVSNEILSDYNVKITNTILVNHARFKQETSYGRKWLEIVMADLVTRHENIAPTTQLYTIAGVFLMYCSATETVQMLDALVSTSHFGALFGHGYPFLYKCYYVHDQLLAVALPELATHLATQRVESGMYSYLWFSTFFLEVLPFSCAVRLLDFILSVGFTGLFAASLAVMSAIQESLLSLQSNHLVALLNDIHGHLKDPEQLIDLANQYLPHTRQTEKLLQEYDARVQSSQDPSRSPPAANQPQSRRSTKAAKH